MAAARTSAQALRRGAKSQSSTTFAARSIQESANDFIVYVGDPEPTAWTKFCVRQADSVVLLARAEAPAQPWPVLPPDAHPARASGLELVLRHEGRVLPGAAARWLAVVPGATHHHICGSDDVARLARFLTGRAVGLVLSGGGARGFAHIGVVQALREAGLPIDLVGGTSIGAVMGAGVACGWSTEEMTERFCRAMGVNRLNDYTLPIVSLVSGRKVSRWLREGDLCRWLRASIAIPGVLPPVFDHGEVHVDGGAMNNLPVDVMRAANRGVVIGVDVGSDVSLSCDAHDAGVLSLWKQLGALGRRPSRPTILQILLRAGMANSNAAAAAAGQLADLLLQPPLPDIDMLHWRACRRTIEAGYQYASQRVAALDADVRARLGLSRES